MKATRKQRSDWATEATLTTRRILTAKGCTILKSWSRLHGHDRVTSDSLSYQDSAKQIVRDLGFEKPDEYRGEYGPGERETAELYFAAVEEAARLLELTVNRRKTLSFSWEAPTECRYCGGNDGVDDGVCRWESCEAQADLDSIDRN